MRPELLAVAALMLAGCTIPNGQQPTPYHEELLSGATFTALVVEIDHAPGRVPSLAAREHLVDQLRAVTSKTRISLTMQETLRDDGSKRWSADDLLALERQTRTTQHAAPVAVLHVLYPAGQFERENVAGVTVTGVGVAPVVVFLDTLDQLQSPAGPLLVPPQARDQVERATLLHEAGHAMGLVNNGLPMVRDHEDPEHEGHSRNPESVMYWQVETLDGLRQALLDDGSVPLYFDSDDRADMRAAGGR